jgi:hypothetical protein
MVLRTGDRDVPELRVAGAIDNKLDAVIRDAVRGTGDDKPRQPRHPQGINPVVD